MNAVAFDTLAFSKRLQKAGVPPIQAEAHASAQSDLLAHHLLNAVATKSDLAEVKAELKTDLAEVKAELKADLAEVKAELKSDLAEVKAELKADLAEVKDDLAGVKIEMKTGFAEVKTGFAEMETKLSLRMLFMAGVLASLMTFFKFMG